MSLVAICTDSSSLGQAAINSKGYVPALEFDGGDVLTENIAILSYIAGKAGALIPAGELGQVRALEALAYISTELHKSFKPFFHAKFQRTGESRRA